MQIASASAQAASIRQQGEAQNRYYNYLADVQEQQALLAERTGKAQSRSVQETQKFEGRKQKLNQAQFRASQRAALAASGVPLSSVTAFDIDRDTISTQALDEAALRHNADIRSFEAITGGQNRAFWLRSQAQGQRIAGANALTASRFSARNTLLGGVGNAFGTLAFTPFTTSSFSFGKGGFGFSSPVTAGVGGYLRNTPAGVRSARAGLFGPKVSLLPRR